MDFLGYDIIGDIHGHADALEALLGKLGYHHRHGAWGHSERLALFVGDFVDRGPRNIRTCRIVMDMMSSGAALAVMGNHDFNSLAMATPDPDKAGDYLREHSAKNLRQTEATRAEFARHPDDAREIIAWIASLPLWIEGASYRLVHAGWDAHALSALRPYVDSRNALTASGLILAARRGESACVARESLLNGPEAPLPEGMTLFDSDNHKRTEFRLAWWRLGERRLTYRRAAVAPPDVLERLPDEFLPPCVEERLTPNDADWRPIFFGHYWMIAPLMPQTSRHFCVDASVARKGGHLAALRHVPHRPLASCEVVYVSP